LQWSYIRKLGFLFKKVNFGHTAWQLDSAASHPPQEQKIIGSIPAVDANFPETISSTYSKSIKKLITCKFCIDKKPERFCINLILFEFKCVDPKINIHTSVQPEHQNLSIISLPLVAKNCAHFLRKKLRTKLSLGCCGHRTCHSI
jgi:hypothetical protein